MRIYINLNVAADVFEDPALYNRMRESLHTFRKGKNMILDRFVVQSGRRIKDRIAEFPEQVLFILFKCGIRHSTFPPVFRLLYNKDVEKRMHKKQEKIYFCD